MCYHKFVDGLGMFGDALTCVKCGYSRYPEFWPLLRVYHLLGRVKYGASEAEVRAANIAHERRNREK